MDVIKTCLNTVFIIVAFLLPSIILVFRQKNGKLAKFLLVTAISLLCLLSFRPFSNFLLWGLEHHYPPLMHFSPYNDVKYIGVLTAWDCDIPNLPYTSNIGYRSTMRALEAHRIYRKLSHPIMIISGSANGCRLMRKLFMLLGVPGKDIVLDQAENTWQSALNMKELIGNQRFILVTSATHLPRTVDAFTRHGMNPVPAPADYLYGYYPEYHLPFPRPLAYYIPNTDSLMRSSAAIYEYLGTLWYMVKTRLNEVPS